MQHVNSAKYTVVEHIVKEYPNDKYKVTVFNNPLIIPKPKKGRTVNRSSEKPSDDAITESLRRTRTTIFDYALSNDFEYFVTFTFNPKKIDRYSIDETFNTMKYWLNRQKKHCVRNGKYGVIVITDEYQNYFSNQDSRNVPPWVIHQAAQNRKQKRLHLVTSQDYDQLVKAVRRRSDIAFRCKSFALPFGLSAGPFFTVYWAFIAKKLEFDNNGKRVDGSRPLKMGFFFQSQALRDSYDTNQVVFTGSQADGVFLASQPTVTVKKTTSSLKPVKKGLIFRHR